MNKRVITTEVYAGAYLPSDSRRVFLTHAVVVVEGAEWTGVSLCGRAKNCADDETMWTTDLPTCKHCQSKLRVSK